jgi:NitT/TauT family transport system permease protein
VRLIRASSTKQSGSPSTAPPPTPIPARGPGPAPDEGVPTRGRRYFDAKEPIPRSVGLGLSLASAVLVLGAWSILSYSGIVEPFFLPTPSTVASALYDMFAHEDFLADVWASALRILLGFLLAALVAVPLGIAIGSYRAAQAFFEPGIAAIRYMPASAFIPLLIIWFGIGENEKVAVIFIGTFFPLALMVADVSANISKELLNISYTLGASRSQVFRKVLLPACWPGVVDNLRIGIGWAWTYLIVAELVAAQTGIGYVILTASRFGETEKIIGGILTIGALGLLTDAFFRQLYKMLFPYAERVAR